jgi:hypothetical protein
MTTDDDTADPKAEADRHSDEAILAQVKRHRKEGLAHLGEWREEARLCYAFVAGEQWTEAEKATLLEQLRLPIVFNRVDPMVQAVAGSEVNNRQQVQYVPRQVGDSGVNEVLTGAADYFREACDAEDEESDGFMDLVISGVGATETLLDYIDNAEGMIKVERRDPLTMLWDGTAKKRNLTDLRWCQHEEQFEQQDIKDKWPDKADEITGATADLSEEGKPIDQVLSHEYQQQGARTTQESKVAVTREQWYELETYYTLVDFGTGQTVDMEAEQFKVLQARTEKLGIPLKSVRKQRKQWFQAFACGDVLLEWGKVPCNECAFKFLTGKRDRNKNIWYGMVRSMMDPQKWANKFFSQFMRIIDTNAKGGLVIEKGAVDNLQKFKRDWSKSDGVTVVEDGAISRRKMMPKPPPQIPPQMSQLMEFAISSLRDVTGVNLELLGMADRDQPGVLEAHRKQAALTILATLFDALRRYRKEQGRLMAKYITEYMSDGRLIRIVGGDGAERYVPLLHQPGVLDYDIIVDESANTVNQKDKTFHVLTQLLPMLDRMGAPFTPDLLEYMPIPAAMAEKWKAAIQQKQQQPPQPDPNVIKANASMLGAQANMVKAQAAAQPQHAQQPPMDPAAWALAQGQQQIDAQELAVRMREAGAEEFKAAAELESAHTKALGLGGRPFLQ